MVPHDGGCAVEQSGDFVIGLSLEDLGEQVRVVAAAGFDEEFLCRGALFYTYVVSLRRYNFDWEGKASNGGWRSRKSNR